MAMGVPGSAREILQSLLPALSYGVRDNFAHLSTLKKLEDLVRSVAQRAEKAGADPKYLGQLLQTTEGFDAAADGVRREALSRLARVLAVEMPLPEPLRRIALDVGPALTPSAKTASVNEVVVKPAARPNQKPLDSCLDKLGTRSGRTEAAPPPSGKDNRKAAAPKKRSRRGNPDAESRASEEEVVYPSVSPTQGPLATPLTAIATPRGKLAASLEQRGIRKVGEVLFFFPRTYEDRRNPVPIARLQLGERGVSIGTVKLIDEVPVRGRRILRVVLGDNTGSIAATWYHYPSWMKKRFKVGERYLFSGEIRAFAGMREVSHPELEPAELVEQDPTSFGRIIPIYPGFDRGEQHGFRALARKVVEHFADQVSDPVPQVIRDRLNLPALSHALRQVHFPDEVDLQKLGQHQMPAQRRLAFDELFLIQLGLALRRKGVKLTPGIQFKVPPRLLDKAKAVLPFQMTGAQSRALDEIAADMARPEPMNRLLQGDVGSGKTAVATAAALAAIENGYQVALMAPTEILADQHFRTLSRWLEPKGYKLALLKSGTSRKEKDEVKAALANGSAQLAVGTHALLQDDVELKKLGLVIIDEQHRFGVLQRARLIQKGVRPDVLVMTATPIPRTLAMTLYGDLDVSVLDELPPGRTPVETRVFSERQRDRVHETVLRELEKGRQAFVVYPLVEESEKSDLANATEGAAQLAERFPGFRVGLVHGRMKVEEKDEVMRQVRDREIHVLVATTVVEVGVDVPNATVMVVEAAHRFGLSQLHQLRGRVGRGAERSYCLLIGADWNSDVAYQRLQIMARSTDGFVIAEKDLELRGPGEFLGTRQSGLPELMVADLTRDLDLLAAAKREAFRLADEDPKLDRPEHRQLRQALDERWEGKLSLARIG